MKGFNLLIAVIISLVAASGVALASEGHLPLLPGGDDGVSVAEDAYGDDAGGAEGDSGDDGGVDDGSVDDGDSDHGSSVSEVARDKDAVGTRTLPNGKVIENHGMAVSEAAHQQGGDDGSSDDSSAQAEDMPSGDDHVSGDGDADSGGQADGNGGGNANGNGHH